MAGMKHIEDSNEAIVPCDDSRKEELEAKGGVGKAQATGKYKVMTMNMDGNHSKAVTTDKPDEKVADKRRNKIVAFLRKYNPDVVFCQELPGYFDTQVLNQLQLNTPIRKWESEKKGKKAAADVLWDGNCFHGCKVEDPSTDSNIMIKTIAVQLKDQLPRTSFVKLTECHPVINGENPISFIAVSYHGKRDIEEIEQIQNFQDLIKLTRELCKAKGNIPFLIGGDFNFDTTKIALPGIEFGKYNMTRRSKRPRKIPFKDNFFWEHRGPTLLSIEMIDLQPCELSQINEDGNSSTNTQDRNENAAVNSTDIPDAQVRQIPKNSDVLLDHDPIIGKLAFADSPADKLGRLDLNKE